MKLVDLNKPIAELNGLTLNEVFKDGLITHNNISGNSDLFLNTDCFISSTNNTSSTNTAGFVYNNLQANNSYYTIWDIQTNIQNTYRLEKRENVWFGSRYFLQDFTNRTFLYHSDIFVEPITRNVFIGNRLESTNIPTTMLLKVQLYNLTALGIANLTKSQLDNYYALYQSGVEASGFVQKTFSGDTKFALAKGIDAVAHGGLTYREIFEGGQLVDLSNFSNVSGNSQHLNVYENDVLTVTRISGTLQSAIQLPTTIPVGVYYHTVKTKATFNAILSYITVNYISGTSGQVKPNLTINNDYQNYSKITERTTTGGTYFLTQSLTQIPIGESVLFKNVYLINLTQLFGAGNEPDKATMDKLFQQYEEAGTVQAQAFIQTAGKDTRVIDAKLPYLNMMSIREVFDSNLVVNGDFSNGTTGWNANGVTNFTTLNNIATFTATSQNGNIVRFVNTTSIINNIIYTTANIKADSNLVALDPNSGLSRIFHSGGNNFQRLSTRFIIPNTSIGYGPRIIDTRTSSFTQVQVKEVYFINLTALNLTHLTQAELDAMFALYEADTLKLSDVFETGNLVANHDFSDGTTGWSALAGATLSVSNGLMNVFNTGTFNAGRLIQNTNETLSSGLKIYQNAKLKLDNNLADAVSLQLYNNVGAFIGFVEQTQPQANLFLHLSNIFTVGSQTGTARTYVEHKYANSTIAANKNMLVDYVYAVNLNTHNLQATTKTFMDDLFKAYNRYKGPLFIDTDGVAYGQVFISKGGQ